MAARSSTRAGLPLAALAPSVALLAARAVRMGLANGVLDVAINVMGVGGRAPRGRRMLASMHAAFSFGAMTGAGGGALAAAAGARARGATWPSPPAWSALVACGAGLGLPPDDADARRAARPSRARRERLLALGAAAFCVLLAEGSVTDWSAVFLNDEAGASEALAAGGLTVFSLAMATRAPGRRPAWPSGSARSRWSASAGCWPRPAWASALATAAPAPGIAGLRRDGRWGWPARSR